MPLPNLDDWTDRLDERCRDYLGETIQYAASGTIYVPEKAHVDYRDMAQQMQVGEAIAQDISVSLMKSDVPAKPRANTRLQLSKRPGKTYRPINVRSDESGTHWEFEVQAA